MADRFDVAARLAEGRPALEHTQTYVQACHVLGYQHPDLTAHSSQIGDWYDTELGLDLRVLDADIAELRAAVNAIEEALWVQRAQVTELAATWRGPGADAATQFLQRHCDAAAEVAAHIRAATEACSALRDDVWQSVDRKVAITVAIDDRRVAERSAWLAAAHAVTANAGDRSAAEEIVREQVNPYVDNDIRGDWVTAMQLNKASVAASYDTAIHVVSSAPEVRFEVPGDLGPARQPAFDEPLPPSPASAPPPVSLPVDPLPTVPAAATEAPQPLSTDGLDSVPPESAEPIGDIGGLSSGAGGLGGLAGNIGGVVGKIVDGIGGLLGSLADGLGDTPETGDSLVDDPLTDEDKPDDTDEDKAETIIADDAEKPSAPDQPAAETVDEPAAPAPPDALQPDAPQPDAPLPAEQSPPAAEQADASTPCEIAEDELPQAGQ
jgi:hypothetical protein